MPYKDREVARVYQILKMREYRKNPDFVKAERAHEKLPHIRVKRKVQRALKLNQLELLNRV